MVTVPQFTTDTLRPNLQAVLAHHADPKEYGQRLEKAGAGRLHGSVGPHLVSIIGRGDRVADIGVGDGFVGRVLSYNGHRDMIFGCDISERNLLYVKSQRLYSQVWHGDAHAFCRQMNVQATIFDWVTMVSVAYYMSPEELAELLTLLAPITRRGVIMTHDAIPESLRVCLAADKQHPLVTYDHTEAWPPKLDGFDRAERVWTGIGWSHSTLGIEVPVDLWVLHKEPMTAH